MSGNKNKDLLRSMSSALGGLSVSSSEHAISSFATEAVGVVSDEFEIPEFYGIDTLRVMSVNVNTIYVYWEITENLLKSKGILGSALLIKLCDESSGDELMNFFITDRLSSRFLSVHLPNMSIYSKIGALVDGVFVELLRSNTFFTPSDEIVMSDDEVWMSKSESFNEILKASAPWGLGHLSSFGIVKELEFLRKSSENIRTNVSSTTNSLKDKE